MRRPFLSALLAAILAVAAFSQTAVVDVGTGSTEFIRQRFVSAFYRNGFANTVSVPPLGDVKNLPPTGLVQEFQDTNKTANVKLALVRPNLSSIVPPSGIDVFQVTANMYAYYSQLGVNQAGYPTADTNLCPTIPGNYCTWQTFDKGFVLFAYNNNLANGNKNFSLSGTLLTKWNAAGGISTLGPASDTQGTVTNPQGTAANFQLFLNGAIYEHSGGLLDGSVFAVNQPVYAVYAGVGGATGFLGLPTSDELQGANGLRRQSFQGGSISYTAGNTPTVSEQIGSIVITSAAGGSGGPIALKLNDTVTVTAVVVGVTGGTLTDRPMVWTTSNNRIVSIVQSSGITATLKATGGGVAFVTASAEGRASPAITVSVNSPCCQIGEGAPTSGIQQAFRDAVTRNQLNVFLPAANPVRRVGSGYLQEFLPSDRTAGVRYVFGISDSVATAYLVTGAQLAAWEANGGPAGTLGYPLSDAAPSGRQTFTGGTIAGIPARLVHTPILTAWTNSGFEAGPAGIPTGDAQVLLSSAATPAVGQSFSGGAYFSATAGARANRPYLVSGLILAKFLSIGAAAGTFGLPISDEFGIDGQRRQNFEGGYLQYAIGDTEAKAFENARVPTVAAIPQTVVSGGRVRFSISGFANNASLRVTVAGQPPFTVTVPAGAYTWENVIPFTQPSGSVRVQASDPASNTAAETTLTVRAASEAQPRLTKVRGDQQAGAPGAALPQTLQVSLTDGNGNPLSAVPVRFTASPGATLLRSAAATSAAGLAEAAIRLPLAEGVVLVTAEAAGQVATFSLRAGSFSIPNFPAFTQSGTTLLGAGPATIAQKGSLLAATAGVVRYLQNTGRAGAGNGAADPVTLNRFLTSFCTAPAAGARVCDGYFGSAATGDQIVNLWRLGEFTTTPIALQPLGPDLNAIRDALVAGNPVLLALRLLTGASVWGGHYVVATGIQADGGLAISDPNPDLGGTSLGDYLAGFPRGFQRWRGELTGAVVLRPAAGSSTAMLASVSQTVNAANAVNWSLATPAGNCATELSLADSANVAAGGPPPPDSLRATRLLACDLAADPAQFAAAANSTASTITIADLAPGGTATSIPLSSASALYRVARNGGLLQVTPQTLEINAGGIVNAATFTAQIAPGSLASVFGQGLWTAASASRVFIGGLEARVVTQSPFQLNFVVPPDTGLGAVPVEVRSAAGSAAANVTISPQAPAIFVLAANGSGPATGAVVNQNGSLNGNSAPARRGEVLLIFATGLGAVNRDGSLFRAQTPVTVAIGGTELPVSFAGYAPTFPGLYQVNVPVPQGIPPGMDQTLTLRQGGQESNRVTVSIQ